MTSRLRAAYRLVLRLLPETRTFDHLIALFTFLRAHRRFPTRKRLFNDVLYRIKTSDEILDPLRVFVSDKELVKVYVKATIGDQYNVPTLGVLRSMDEVLGYRFPASCCIKPTHLTGEVILRRDDAPVDLERIAHWLRSNHYHVNREANYRTLRPKIIVEPLIFDSDDLMDYKFFCCEGRPKLIQVDVDRHTAHARKFFDCAWNELPFSLLYPMSPRRLERPANLERMLELSAALSAPFDFVRVDMYSDGRECLLGEITNCHGNAWESFLPASGEALASRMIFGEP
jgi:hypothetical protein